jgi:transposase
MFNLNIYCMKKNLTIEIINTNAAGIDVGSKSHFVCIGQKEELVKEFGVYTKDHDAIILWLKRANITSIAMESTGSYWQTLFTALQTAGFEVLLVNARDIKNVKGKKTDVIDCMWIQKLHSLGLLRGSFLPDEFTRQLKTFYYHRQGLLEQCAKYTLKMQKAMRLMNIRLDVSIRDITGKTGRAIIDAILSGERNSYKLAELADVRIKRNKSELADSLKGEWKQDLLFVLEECLDLYDYYKSKINSVDEEIEKLLSNNFLVKQSKNSLINIKKKKSYKNDISFDLRSFSYKIFDVDLYQITGISNGLVLSLLSTLGNGINKFPSSKHFVSWLRLAPNNKISGGHIISSRTPKGKNKLALALRQAANSIGNAKHHHLKNFFNRIAYKKGRGAAITSTARKLAIIIYNMILKKVEFNTEYCKPKDIDRFKKIKSLQKTLNILELSDTEKELIFRRI